MKIVQTLVSVAVAATLLTTAMAQGAKHKIDAKAAAKIALRKYPGKLTKTPRLEHEDGVWQYEVLIKKGKDLLEVNVNADTGKIASTEKTSAAEEAKEGKKKGS